MRKIRRMLISLLAAAISAAALPVFANQPAAPVFVSPSFYGRVHYQHSITAKDLYRHTIK